MIIKVFLIIVLVALTPVVAAKLAYNATAHRGLEPISEPWVQDSMEFITWNGEKWTGWIRDDAFEHRPQNEAKWSNHSNTSLAFMDWNNTPSQVKIDGDSFLLAHHGDWHGHTERANAIRYRDWQGKNQIRTLDQLKR